MLTADRARELFVYDPDTGRLTHRLGRRGTRAGSPAGTVKRNGRIDVEADGRKYKAHRVIWLLVHGCWPSGDIDHINGEAGDNRLVNLRDVPHAVNMQNMRRPMSGRSRPGSLGAHWVARRGKWQAAISINGKTRNLGYFDSEEAAAAAYLAKKREVHPGCTL